MLGAQSPPALTTWKEDRDHLRQFVIARSTLVVVGAASELSYVYANNPEFDGEPGMMSQVTADVELVLKGTLGAATSMTFLAASKRGIVPQRRTVFMLRRIDDSIWFLEAAYDVAEESSLLKIVAQIEAVR